MEDLYDTVEGIILWGGVILTFGLVVYLAYLQYRKIKHSRARRHHRAHRALRHSRGPAGDQRPSHSHGS